MSFLSDHGLRTFWAKIKSTFGASSSVLFGDGLWKQIATNPITEEENLFIDYSTSAPTEDNIDGLKIVILDSEPEKKCKGYLYLISEA